MGVTLGQDRLGSARAFSLDVTFATSRSNRAMRWSPRLATQRLFEAILAHHTTGEQAAAIFGRVGAKLAVFSHAEGTVALAELVRRTYAGRVEAGEDLMVIEIADEVTVRRRER